MELVKNFTQSKLVKNLFIALIGSIVLAVSAKIQTPLTPVPVTIFSDEMTEVVIYKIGNLGVFKQNIVSLRPGVYIATGSRTGYRDLQIRFKVSGNTTNQTIRVECKERI